MLYDVRSIVWKEWGEFVRQRSTIIGMSTFLAIFGVFLPLQRGAGWVNSSGPVFNSVILPLMLVLSVVTDSFAGERERHTLETLLASRLSDRAILFGKYLAVVLYAWGLTVGAFLLGCVTVNITDPSGGPHLYPAALAVNAALFALLMAGMAAGVGVLISLRASTVRQAAQTLSVGMTGLMFGIITALTTMPDGWRDALGDGLRSVGPVRTALLVGAALLLLDLALFAGALARFRRDRLILD